MAGETLRTKDHDTVRRWAKERDAAPATQASDERAVQPTILCFDFPDHHGENLQHISWEQFFRSFDECDLTFIYQETRQNGARSNFYRFDQPRDAEP